MKLLCRTGQGKRKNRKAICSSIDAHDLALLLQKASTICSSKEACNVWGSATAQFISPERRFPRWQQVVLKWRFRKERHGRHGSALRFEPDLVIDRMSQPLLTPEVSLRRFHRNVTEKELDLLKLSARRVA
jgi:hypothetical protein